MLKRFIRMISGDPNKRVMDKYSGIVDEINALEPTFESLSDQELSAKTDEFRQRLENGSDLDDILVEAFATVREASKRTIGLRHFDVQMIGGIILHHGSIAEMRTGEGKTLVATLPIYLNALTQKSVHLVTVNDYLARRDARWMAPIFEVLGLSVGVLQIAARTENGKKAYLVDLSQESPHEDQNQLKIVPRRLAYAADIVYGTNSEFGFDYLRDNMTLDMDERVQRGHYFAIVDEVDNVLIDEARTPLIISGPAEDESPWYLRMSQVVRQLKSDDVEVDEKNRVVVLTELGEIHVGEILGSPLRDPDRPEDLTPEQAQLLGYLEQSMRAHFLFKRNKDYLVQGGKVIIVDEFTGRLMPGRRWSEGLHQAVEAKENVKVEPESVTYATITIQNYFRMYNKLAGMTGTALTESEEFDKIYKLEAIGIPTNLEFQASQPDSELIEAEGRDDSNTKYKYFTKRAEPTAPPVFWRRKDYPDIVYRTEEMKLRAIIEEIFRFHVLGRPVLIGTTSVELSERVSSRLRAEPLKRLAQALLIRHTWFIKNNREEDGRQIPELQFLFASLDKLDITEMRKMARDLEIPYSLEDPLNLRMLGEILNLNEFDQARLVADLQGGIPHEVLNAKKHTEESQIIAGAGAFGAVTIATNMAGRGVDIKLGGELAEEILAAVNRVLRKSNFEHPYTMTMKEQYEALKKLDPSDYGIYDQEIQFFFQHLDEMESVRKLGGLHIIGSERHEARRIDNQLRGRAARQGDPGSSRFYLSMEDPLMKMFGGAQADSLMQRFKIDDALPLEANMVGRIVEQSQTRVEGANFDLRKHLLEYDDVLNNQRRSIYEQRNLIFTKPDLSDDVLEMLQEEIARRIPQAMQNEEGPWQLLAWLNDTQPAFMTSDGIFPTFTVKLLENTIVNGQSNNPRNSPLTSRETQLTREKVQKALQEVVVNSLVSEEEHVHNWTSQLLEKSQKRAQEQIEERSEAVDLFFEGLRQADETDNRKPLDLLTELQTSAGLMLRLTPEQQKSLRQGSDSLKKAVLAQVKNSIFAQAVQSVVVLIERRLDEQLGWSFEASSDLDWDQIEQDMGEAVTVAFAQRKERLVGNESEGILTREIAIALDKSPEPISQQDIINLLTQLPQGTKTGFDKKNHQRVVIRTNRLNYFFYAAKLIEGRGAGDLTELVLEHLERALELYKNAWGLAEWKQWSNNILSDLPSQVQSSLATKMGEEWLGLNANQSLFSLPTEEKDTVIAQLGRNILTANFRQLILNVISSLWIDYLTEMEGLRISISLEAYAQRDPLVAYKNKASSLFQELIANVRQGVISRIFTFRPRNLASLAVSDRNEAAPQAVDPNISQVDNKPDGKAPATAQPEPGSRAPDQSEAVRNDTESEGRSKRRRHNRR